MARQGFATCAEDRPGVHNRMIQDVLHMFSSCVLKNYVTRKAGIS